MSQLPYKPESLPLPEFQLESLVSAIANAHSALARYDGRLEGIPNPRILLSPLSTREAVLSSKIEGTQATLDEVLEFEADPESTAKRYDDIEEIINYRKAMRVAETNLKSRPMSLNLIKSTHSQLLEGVRGRDKGRGEFRKIQNWIGADGTPMVQAKYVPPTVEDMNFSLNNWESYYHSDDKDPLVQLAIVHAQFEVIHPFIDGNGRIGRMLIPLFLFEKKILSSPMFYLSDYLEQTRDEYYERLLMVSKKKDWNGWIKYFLQAIAEQAKKNSEQTRKIMNLYDEMKDQVVQLTKSRYAIQILDFLFTRPIFRSSVFSKESGMPKPSVPRVLKALEQGKVLKIIREAKGRQPAIYTFESLLEIVRN